MLSRSGFTLMELVVVLGITAVLVSLTIPGILGMSRSFQLGTAGDLMVNQFSFARQAAQTNDQLVQVRLYRLPDYNQAPTAGKTVYRAIQCFAENDAPMGGTPTLTALTRTIFFPAPVILSTVTSPNLSPLLASTPTAATSSDPTLPTYGSNYDYTSFHFKPDGSTDLSTGTNSVTLILNNDKAAITGLPANYRTIQIDPVLGIARLFTP